jgi:hypothetical protein
MSRTHTMARVFARCASDGDAELLQAQLLQALSATGAEPHGKPRRYAKMPELFEFTFAAIGQQHFSVIASLCQSGWFASGDEDDPSLVWNAEPGCTFLHAQVVWAELLTADL